MNDKRFLILILMIFVKGSLLMAQTTNPSTSKATVIEEMEKPNIIKINLLALPLRTLTLQYERVLNKSFSAALAIRFMPSGSLPFKNWFIKKIADGDAETAETLENMRLGNFAITPEIRIYLSKKGYGQGVYLAPAYRFAQYNIENLQNSYFNDDERENLMYLSGKMTTNYGGITLGSQWSFGNYFSLDWWLFAPFIGVEKTTLNGRTSLPLTEQEQNDFIDDLESIDIPYTTISYCVHENGAVIQLHGLMAGLSAGISLGVRF